MATANSAAYSITYSGESIPIANAGTDSIGQRCAVMKATGNDSGGDMHFAVRTSGPYGVSDGQVIRAGTGAVFTQTVINASRQSVLVCDLEPDTPYYWGAAFDTGAESTVGQFTTKSEPTPQTGIPPEGIQP